MQQRETAMSESVSDTLVVKPPKRRRILDPSAVVPVPVYSNKVSSSLQLKPKPPVVTEKENTGSDNESLWFQFPSTTTTTTSTTTTTTAADSDSDEAEFIHNKTQPTTRDTEVLRSPSPPPPGSPVHRPSRKVQKKISEVDRTLRAVDSLLSPDSRGQRRPRRGRRGQSEDAVAVVTANDDEDDDIIIVSPVQGSQESPYSSVVREIPLKVRCRTQVHKVPVLSSSPLSYVVSQLSIILQVPPPRLLLLREEEELQLDATVRELGLGIADIIDCVVMAAEDSSISSIRIRLQGKDRDSSQEFSLSREAPLGSIFSQYLSKMAAGAQRNVHFHFDGVRLKARQTPAQLDMEDGDIIEVWV